MCHDSQNYSLNPIAYLSSNVERSTQTTSNDPITEPKIGVTNVQSSRQNCVTITEVSPCRTSTLVFTGGLVLSRKWQDEIMGFELS